MASVELARLLRAIADVIERGDAVEVTELTKAFTNMTRKKVNGPSKSENEKSKLRPNLSIVEEDVRVAQTREQGKNILYSYGLTKAELVKMGRGLNVHITKQDGISAIEDKIVESLVGARLNSLAIRGGRE